jgi:type VI secretion system secreted protein VgrG
MALTQENRHVEFTSPLGKDVLLFHRMTAVEELGRLFRLELELLSEESEIKFKDILGQNVTIRLNLPDNQIRYFNGFVSRFKQEETTVDDFSVYSATVHPWLWFLTLKINCRIFQEMTVPDIIKKVFKDSGFTDYEESLSGSYRTWEYCVQYRESDFDFVSRLMEQEGIYYYFKHEKTKHTLVMSDSVSSHEPYSGYEKLPYYPPSESLLRERDHIYNWQVNQTIQSGVCELNDFDFERPKADLKVKSSIAREHAYATQEIFDYPGEYIETGDGETYARTRIEEAQAQYERIVGEGNARGLCSGSLFQLSDYPREDQNREYLIVTVEHEVELNAYTSNSGTGSTQPYMCKFTAMPSKEPFRSACITTKPVVRGPQTAIVTGPAGDEIHTDKYGRIKVGFHWDRESQLDETSSCWVRVAQIWAGKQWGGIHIPRVGQEVIVDFLEGDPDRPIITGSVYNNDNMPPYDLPANATQSGIKSRSTVGGTAENFNEIRLEDKKGSEEIFLQGEKDWTINIKNDKTQTIGNDETVEITNNKTETVGKDKEVTVGQKMTLTAEEELILECGQAKVTLKKTGDIAIEGMMIEITAQGGIVLTSPKKTMEI